MNYNKIFCVLFLLHLCLNEINGQVLSPPHKKGEFEAGCTFKWFHRELDNGAGHWWHGSIFARYGIADWWTVSAEGLVVNFEDSDRPEGDYRHYVVGIGFAIRIFHIKSCELSALLQYGEWFGFDRSEIRHHENIRSIVGAIQFCYPVSISKQKILLWMAPAYIYDEVIDYYPYGPSNGIREKSINNYGMAFGCNML